LFTGIIEELGSVEGLAVASAGARLTIAVETLTDGLRDGDSVAVNGVCLTAIDISPGSFSADVSPETLDRTTLRRLRAGKHVNLERAMLPTTRFGGHIVQGHVDGRGEFISATPEGDFWTVKIGFPDGLRRYFVEKGSVAVEGISLTIAALGEDHFNIAIIPKTWTETNLSSLAPGDPVNIEADVIAKYVERLVGQRPS
jgi:riboflavin synthase